MNIPYWLLRLLPMWEYICPKCKKGVKQSVHQCLHCGEKFPLAIRVPPSFLKDPKKLEAYVHKHVFPRVSEFERNYLTKYFTELFSDGFESGNFSAWTGTEVTATYGEAIVNSELPHHGTYSGRFSITQYGGWTNAYATKDLGTNYGETPIYIRAYVNVDYFSGSPAIRGMVTLGGYGHLMYLVGIYNAARNLHLFYYHDGTYSEVDSSTTLNLDQWYCLEIKGIADTDGDGSGEVHVYLNGTEVTDITKTGLVQDSYAAIRSCGVGIQNGYSTLARVYIDCVVVADAYIGPEVAAPKGTIAIHAKLAGII